MLGGAEGSPADTALGVQDAFIEALVGEDALATQRLIEMAQALVQEAAVDDANVVAEITGRAVDQVGRRCRRVGKAAIAFGDQPDGLERRQKRPRTIGRNPGGRGDPGERIRATCDLREQVEIQTPRTTPSRR